jgi:hypothetical protein
MSEKKVIAREAVQALQRADQKVLVESGLADTLGDVVLLGERPAGGFVFDELDGESSEAAEIAGLQ